jgi:hypothetical protein
MPLLTSTEEWRGHIRWKLLDQVAGSLASRLWSRLVTVALPFARQVRFVCLSFAIVVEGAGGFRYFVDKETRMRQKKRIDDASVYAVYLNVCN